MVKLKLQRIGRKNLPHFRLIAQESSKDPWDKSNEILGWINPRTKEKELKKDRIEYWLSVGAQATNTVNNLLIEEEIIKGEKAKTVKISKKRAEKLAAKKTGGTPAEPAEKEAKPKGEENKTETPAEEKKEEAPAEEKTEEPKEEKKEEEKSAE